MHFFKHILAHFYKKIGYLLTVVILFYGQPILSGLTIHSEEIHHVGSGKIIIKNKEVVNLKQLLLDSPDTRFIYLYNNKLKELPKEIGGLVKLKTLIVSSNHLIEIPDEIGDLSNLNKLSLKHNRLKFLPETIGHLNDLVELYVNNNQLRNLPENIGNLESLMYLDISYNRIKELPKTIVHLYKLNTFRIGKNQLTSLPPRMDLLGSMVELNLVESGKLLRIPEELGKLSRLELLIIDENTILPYSLKIQRQRLKIQVVNSRGIQYR